MRTKVVTRRRACSRAAIQGSRGSSRATHRRRASRGRGSRGRAATSRGSRGSRGSGARGSRAATCRRTAHWDPQPAPSSPMGPAGPRPPRWAPRATRSSGPATIGTPAVNPGNPAAARREAAASVDELLDLMHRTIGRIPSRAFSRTTRRGAAPRRTTCHLRVRRRWSRRQRRRGVRARMSPRASLRTGLPKVHGAPRSRGA